MRGAFRFFIALLLTSMKASMSKRGAFVFEAAFMIANNLLFFAIWRIFFRQFPDVAGWNFTDLMVLMAVGTGGYGLMQICFGGVRVISRRILDGGLDAFLTRPKNVLMHLAGSQSFAKGWGHLFTAFLLTLFAAKVMPLVVPLVVLSILSGCLVFTAIHVIAHSLPFWLGSVEAVSKKYCDALFLFANYPTNIYSGFLQFVMFTLLPAGVISYLPVELVHHFSWTYLVLLLGSSAAFLALAFCIFYAGLKRYESGNLFM